MLELRYASDSLRFKEHLFARHFCDAFPHVRSFTAPFWKYDCVNFLLCPQWASLPCVVMEDPWRLIDSNGVQRSSAPSQQGKESQPAQTNLAPAMPSLSAPHGVLILGEGGSGAAMLSQLFARSAHYMLWREPPSWRFSAHMPDELFGAMLAGVFRCELSAQQLCLLHSLSPDLATAVPEATSNDEESEEDNLAKRYSIKGLNRSEPRFCGPGMATAALVTRFNSGLPVPLQQLPDTKIVLLVRNPVDIIVARLQAKWVRGGPAWPACTLRTIERCADELCSSMMQMLRSLPTSGDRLRLLRWETFARRKQRVAADLLSWLGATANHTAVGELMVEVDGELRAFKALSDKYPISPRSTFMVERRCAEVMQWLDYKPTIKSLAETAVAAGRSTSGKRYVERGGRHHSMVAQRRRGSMRDQLDANVSRRAIGMEPVLMLRHLKSPEFSWCPVHLAGAEPIIRFFVRRDTPQATTAPMCFPDHAADRCPSRHGAKWHRSRWGPYPFDVLPVEGSDTERFSVQLLAAQMREQRASSTQPSGLSFAFVRNPFDRLVSAYERHIAAQDKGTMIHRAWIRELHSLGDKDPITFSHFVRWVAQQDVSVMHRAWQPFTETCRFGTVRYDFVGRLEHLQADFGRVMRALKLDATDQRLWEQVSSKSAPTRPIGSDDRVLRLQHYFESDDAHDLISIVKSRYRDDLRLFGYGITMPQH